MASSYLYLLAAIATHPLVAAQGGLSIEIREDVAQEGPEMSNSQHSAVGSVSYALGPRLYWRQRSTTSTLSFISCTDVATPCSCKVTPMLALLTELMVHTVDLYRQNITNANI